MTVRAIGDSVDGSISDIPRLTPAGKLVTGPMVIKST